MNAKLIFMFLAVVRDLFGSIAQSLQHSFHCNIGLVLISCCAVAMG